MDLRKLLSPARTRVLVGLMALVVLLGAGWVVHDRMTGLPDDAALRYDGHVVTKSELDRRADTLNALYGIAKPTDAAARGDFQRDIAKSVAVSLILDKAARDRHISISEKSARDTLASMLAAQLGPEPRRAFEQLLTEFGVSEGDILGEIRRQQAIAQLFKSVTQKTVDGVSVADAQARYDADPAAFARPERRKIANIVVAERSEARRLLARARAGDGFAALAREMSLDDATRAKGGLLGVVTANDLDVTYSKAAFRVEAGDFFGPVQTAYGWNVGAVLQVLPGRALPFSKVQADALDVVRSERALTTWREWLARQIKDAEVEYADDYRPEHPDEPPAEVGPSTGGVR
ncbi:peptidylprolyl isomerase [Nocardioides daejeonensis]|uniref:peptidylprolyl isomerase n=1 Tax=Nocardioides daejeonensis TaxID=1046556 RepID=UPI000D7457DB|nr:peptidyl-prolyl cis-trans isomerase [Nocardioides daejeonensis]